ncbi:MAG: transglycosylase SLT domain-containing protein [Paracoccaceae bacterium]
MSKPVRTLKAFVAAVTICIPAAAATAVIDPAELCENAAVAAASSYQIPESLMRGLTLTETGRTIEGRLRPWPWAINQAGTGHWFANRDEMIAHARRIISEGATNFDLGCFQLNYRWHAAQFASLEDMIDPEQNAQYAAGHLSEKYTEKGSWEGAVAAYHSATPEHANRYLARFTAIHAGLADEPAPPRLTAPAIVESENLFPFLVSGASGHGGSLVPMVAAVRPLIGGDQ